MNNAKRGYFSSRTHKLIVSWTRRKTMTRAWLELLFVCFTLTTCTLGAQAPSAAPQVPDESAIRAAITAQTEAWNRADIPAFMQTYENSPETTFIGAHLAKGYGPICSLVV